MKKVMAIMLIVACCFVARGESEMFTLDTRDGKRVTDRAETIRWSGLWEGDSSATVVVTLNNKSLVNYKTGEGEIAWDELEPGTYTFKHMTFQNGIRMGPPLTATFEIVKETETTATGVPYQWLVDWWLAEPDVSREAYEAAALTDYDGDGFEAWQEYVAGTDPDDSESVFSTGIEIVDGSVVISWTQPIYEENPVERAYTVQQLVDGEWKDVLVTQDANEIEIAKPDTSEAEVWLYRVKVDLL